jgi:K+-sensing histidine kinase KdpD
MTRIVVFLMIRMEGIMGIMKTLILEEESRNDFGFIDKKEIIHMIKILSHDVRSPLITVAAGLKMIKKGAYGPIDEGVREEIEKLYEVITKTTGNMEDFMEKAFSLDGDLNSHHETLDIGIDILNPVLGEFQKEIREGVISIENRIDLKGFYTTVGNRFLLKAVFRNLISNGLKYGGKGCKIRINIDDCGSIYKINVFNSGSPVPEEDRNMLFKKFCRIGKRDNGELEGIGLGLYLVREILETHGGKIWYEARQDGSNFIFTMPKHKEQIILKHSISLHS